MSESSDESRSTAKLEVAGYKFERIDEWEIRMESPTGEAWRLRYADQNDGFARFIWEFAVAATSNASVRGEPKGESRSTDWLDINLLGENMKALNEYMWGRDKVMALTNAKPNREHLEGTANERRLKQAQKKREKDAARASRNKQEV